MVFVRSARDGGDMWLWFAHPWPYEIASRLCAKGTVRSGFFDPQLRETTEGLAIAYWFYDIYVRTFVWNHSCGVVIIDPVKCGSGSPISWPPNKGTHIQTFAAPALEPWGWWPHGTGRLVSHHGSLDCELCPTWRLHHQKSPNPPIPVEITPIEVPSICLSRLHHQVLVKSSTASTILKWLVVWNVGIECSDA